MPAPSASTPFWPNLNQQVVREPEVGPNLVGLHHPMVRAEPARKWRLSCGVMEAGGGDDELLRENFGWRVEGNDDDAICFFLRS